MAQKAVRAPQTVDAVTKRKMSWEKESLATWHRRLCGLHRLSML
jgi:hypothetical protein